jgi:hypothetical protein
MADRDSPIVVSSAVDRAESSRLPAIPSVLELLERGIVTTDLLGRTRKKYRAPPDVRPKICIVCVFGKVGPAFASARIETDYLDYPARCQQEASLMRSTRWSIRAGNDTLRQVGRVPRHFTGSGYPHSIHAFVVQ